MVTDAWPHILPTLVLIGILLLACLIAQGVDDYRLQRRSRSATAAMKGGRR